MKMFFVITAALVLAGFSTFADEGKKAEMGAMKEKMKGMHEEMKAGRDAVTAACKEDAAKAGCAADQTMGKGLMKCFHDYKEKNKDFKLSETCKSAHEGMKDKHAEMKEKMKGMKEDMKAKREEMKGKMKAMKGKKDGDKEETTEEKK